MHVADGLGSGGLLCGSFFFGGEAGCFSSSCSNGFLTGALGSGFSFGQGLANLFCFFLFALDDLGLDAQGQLFEFGKRIGLQWGHGS